MFAVKSAILVSSSHSPLKNNCQKTSLPPKSQIGEFQNVKGPLINESIPFPQGQNATCIITCNSYDQITLTMHVHSDFVTNSYSESSDSSHEKS